MRRGFTLIELLVVVAIMGILGTVSVAGYRGMQRGMEERGAMQNVNQFIRSAYQRAQIDRQPVAVYFWNETLRDERKDDETMIVVGKAVAVRRASRFTRVTGSYLCDEFGDLSFNRLVQDGDAEGESGESADAESTTPGNGVYIYSMNGDEGSQPKRALVSQNTVRQRQQELLLLGPPRGSSYPVVEIESYAYKMLSGGNWQPKAGDAYGFEFAELELPHNYIFGSSFSKSSSSPVAGEDVIRFSVSANSGSGSKGGLDGKSSITVSSLRPDSSGSLAAQKVADSDSPTKDIY